MPIVDGAIFSKTHESHGANYDSRFLSREVWAHGRTAGSLHYDCELFLFAGGKFGGWGLYVPKLFGPQLLWRHHATGGIGVCLHGVWRAVCGRLYRFYSSLYCATGRLGAIALCLI